MQKGSSRILQAKVLLKNNLDSLTSSIRKKVRRGDEEVLVLVQWESEEDWKNWEKSPEHLAGHKARAGQAKPDYVIESAQNVYYVRSSK